MTFIESIKTCFKKYITIKGRAPRSEYWWFQAMFAPLFLFVVIVSEAENLESTSELIIWFYLLCFVIVILSLIPIITVTIRRFHDTNKSGWYFLLGFIPLVGSLIVTVMMIPEGTKGKNKYGPNPLIKRKK
tara:strand:+ start:175 stop:567 length:393 start_codon:yes stop_codon:yes gene_type:complete